MRAAARSAILLLAGLLLGTGVPAATLYVNRVVLASPGSVSLEALVRSSVAPGAAAREQLSRSVAVVTDTVQYLPVSAYASQLESAFGADAIIVGAWSLVVPRGTSAEGQPYLLDRLADYLVSQGLLAEAPSQIMVTLGSSSGAAPRDGTPVFQVVRTPRGTEVSFQLTGSSGGTVSGRASLPPADLVADSGAPALKSAAVVRVVFRRGPITVEMPGRVVAGGGAGQAVTVYVPDSQKTFTGRVLDGKAVQVDLP